MRGTPHDKEQDNPHDKGLIVKGTPHDKEQDTVYEELPPDLAARIRRLRKRSKNRKQLWYAIRDLCALRAMTTREIALHLGRSETYIRNSILPNVRAAGLIQYLYPDEPYRADQAYVATDVGIPDEL